MYLCMGNIKNQTKTSHTIMKNWYAVYVRLYHEKKIRDRLTVMGIENFLPVKEEIRQWSDHRKKMECVVMPMIIFVHVTPNEYNKVLTIPSVVNFMILREGNAPMVISDQQMEKFKIAPDYTCANMLIGAIRRNKTL